MGDNESAVVDMAASTSVGWTLAFLIIIIYVFAVAFRILWKDNSLGQEESNFESVPAGMRTMLLPGLLPDNESAVMDMVAESFWFACLFMLFIVLGAFTVMNMLIGVLCEVVSMVAENEREQLNAEWVKEVLQGVLEELDENNDGKLSREEVGRLIMQPRAAKVISEVGVDVEGLVDLAEFYLFNESDDVMFEDFIGLVLQLRGSNDASVKDLVDLRRFMVEEMQNMEDRMKEHIYRAASPNARSVEKKV